MNLPNQLTIARLFITGLFVAVMSAGFPHSRSIALLLFAVASITDFLDGYLARKLNLITNFGKLMDPLADKVLMCAAFVLLTGMGHIPAWIVIVILAREFLVTGLRLVASAEGHVLAAEKLGKHKTTWQIITVIYLLVYLASAEPMFSWFRFLFDWQLPGADIKPLSVEVAGQILIWITLLLTVISGLGYLLKNRALFQDRR